jgi:hypothetical protein
MRRARMTATIAVVACTLVFVGCRSMTGRSFGQQFDDKNISSQVKTRLMTDRAGNTFSTGVGTQFGVVRLTGTVPTEASKEEAERIAWRVAGVKGVKNEIVVVPKETPRTANAAAPAAAAGATAAASPAPTPAAASASTPPAATPTAAPAASPATTRSLAMNGQVTSVDSATGDVTVRTDGGGELVVRFPASAAKQLEQGQRISITAAK